MTELHARAARFLVPLVVLGLVACDAITSIAVSGADFGGATADAHCDRRFVTQGGDPSAFCQEIVSTVAASQFSDDCRNQHHASPGPGLCARARIIAGCKLDKHTDDGSKVWDWYYDVSDIVADAGVDAGPDGGALFVSPTPRDVHDVSVLCADRTRYEDGAELATP